MDPNLTLEDLAFHTTLISPSKYWINSENSSLEHIVFDGKRHPALCHPPLSQGTHYISVMINAENKEYNDCVLGFCQH